MNKYFLSYFKCHPNTRSGVSLTELAVVVAIIGLLLASIVGGTSLLAAAKVKKVIVEFETTRQAIDDFYDKYDYLPGDYDEAVATIGATSNGNGNTIIEGETATNTAPLEDLYVWDHLASAELIRGSYSATYASVSTRYAIGTNALVSEAFTSGAYSFKRIDSTYDSAYYGTTGTALKLGTLVDLSVSEESLPYGGIVTARDAFAIDDKIDDGSPYKGFFYTIRDLTSVSSNCLTNDHTASTSQYKLDDNSTSCHLVYWYKKD